MKVTQVWHSNAKGWNITTWRESKYGGKRRFLKTRPLTADELLDV